MRRLLTLVSAVVLAGCATLPDVSLPPPQAMLARPQLDAFHVTGRLAAQRGEAAVNGRFAWQHAKGQDRWQFFSPLGQTVAELDAADGMAVLQLADGERQVAPLDTLLARMLGADVPVAMLPRWLQAGVIALDDVRERDPQGRPQRIVEQGWEVRYRSYASDAFDAPPRLVEVSRGEVSLKLLVEQWQ
ncbi:outer membrane lipoprotein LolB [Denitromonas iodatirespirans]|uniref:Outer-membrane lipoprotein LolB n=1 Tax=Denitromonas iodatirespirans TaxID=2795389 RepID=A0A944D7X8_DENI1|nr:outer membrane lipoprotein LolB [Denitromonas iodatirespirans]MBT0959668.1 outer membrane lipoprotein LolB [Denitromonas iodatirespirans]